VAGEVQARVEAWQAEGRRVLAVARRSLAPDEAADTDLSLVGLVALGDPPRPGAARALREAAALGLSVKILMMPPGRPWPWPVGWGWPSGRRRF